MVMKRPDYGECLKRAPRAAGFSACLQRIMKRKQLRIENPFRSMPQSQLNVRQRILFVERQEELRRLNFKVFACSGPQVDTSRNRVAA